MMLHRARSRCKHPASYHVYLPAKAQHFLLCELKPPVLENTNKFKSPPFWLFPRVTLHKMVETLQSIAKAMVAPGRGILAADESTSTIQKRFDAIKVEVRLESGIKRYKGVCLESFLYVCYQSCNSIFVLFFQFFFFGMSSMPVDTLFCLCSLSLNAPVSFIMSSMGYVLYDYYSIYRYLSFSSLNHDGCPSHKNTEANRQAYRELLFTAPGFEKYISGVILFDETLRQKSHDGIPFPELLKSKGI